MAWYGRQHGSTRKARALLTAQLGHLKSASSAVSAAARNYSSAADTLDIALSTLLGHCCGVASTITDAQSSATAGKVDLEGGLIALSGALT